MVIRLNNKESEDAKLDGKVETLYKGTIKDNNKICLVRDNEKIENCFIFSKIKIRKISKTDKTR